MQRRQSRVFQATLALPFLLLVLAAGCSSEHSSALPQAPQQADPAFIAETGPSGQGPAVQGSGRGWSGPGMGTRMSVVLINGQFGGTVRVGRFTLTVPRGAFVGVIPITLVDSSSRLVECQLLPEGLYFNVPVTLQVSLMGTTAGADTGVTIFWQDPLSSGSSAWVDLHGEYNPATNSVTAHLDHFSVYRPGEPIEGRAGW